MTFDPTAFLKTITRAVESHEREGAPAKTIVASRVFATDVDDLWDAVTSPERLPRWFLPVSGELRLGGRYHLEGNASGTVTACDPPRSFEATWEFGGEMSWIAVALAPEGDGTRLTLRHTEPYSPERWAEFGPGAGGVGWDGGFLGLARHIEGIDGAPSPEEAIAWMASPEAKRMYRASSEAWRRASIADGTPEDEALAAAERTSAFYTGEAPGGPCEA